MDIFTIAISGSRSCNNESIDKIIDTLNKINNYMMENNKIIKIHVGDCKTGVDNIVYKWCKNNNILHQIFIADWKSLGKYAGPVRNKEMIINVNFLFAFPSPQSKGTISAINIAREKGVKMEIIEII